MHVENTSTILNTLDICMRLATQINTALTEMENKYESLATVLSEATVAPDQITQSQAESFYGIKLQHMSWVCVCHQVHPRSKKTDIQKDFVAITKMDVSMNSLLVRAKFFSLRFKLLSCLPLGEIISSNLPAFLTPPAHQNFSTGLRGMKPSTAAPSAVGSDHGVKGNKSHPKAKKPKAAKGKATSKKPGKAKVDGK